MGIYQENILYFIIFVFVDLALIKLW